MAPLINTVAKNEQVAITPSSEEVFLDHRA